MKKIIPVLILLSLLIIVACEEELPPEPGSPGSAAPIGQVTAATTGSNWAVNATDKFEVNPISFELNPTEKDNLTATVKNQQYVYKYGYSFNKNTQQWERFTFEGAAYPQSNWIKGQATKKIPISRTSHALGENTLAAYGCNKNTGGSWDCNGNKWMPSTFNVTPKCEDPDGKDYHTQGNILGVDNNNAIVNANDTCTSNTAVKEYYCSLALPYSRAVSEIKDCAVGFPRGVCLNGACRNTPFSSGSAPSKQNPVTAGNEISAPSIQLSKSAATQLSIQATHDLMFSEFSISPNDQTHYDYYFNESPNNVWPVQRTVSVSGVTVPGSIPVGWILKSATKTINFQAQNTIISQRFTIQNMQLNLGKNYLYVYGCDQGAQKNQWNCNWRKKEFSIVSSCIDSDGTNQTNKGDIVGMKQDLTITDENSPLQDGCADDDTVQEYYCQDVSGTQYINTQNIDCAQGEVCFNGACETYTAPTVPSGP